MTAATSLAQLINRRRADTAPIFRDGAGRRVVTGADLAHAAAGWSAALHELTQAESTRPPVVALALADPLAFARAYLGLLAAGGTVAPLDPSAPADLLRSDLQELGAQALVCDAPARFRDVPVPVLPARPGVPGQHPDGPAGTVLLRSSGSTGPRKLVPLPERQLLHVAAAVADAHRLGPADVGYSPLSLFHVNAEVVGLLATLVAGSSLVLDPRFSRRRFWPTVARHRVTWINAVPAMLAVIEHDGDPARGRPPGAEQVRFVRSASAPLPIPVLQRFEKTYGIPVVETYGMTEAASQICANPLDARRPGSVGVPVAVELEVRSADGAVVGAGVTGQVHIRGAGVNGGDRWLATGDLGRRDTDGYLYLTGRVSEVINRGGEKLFPREIEHVLAADPRVAEALVVGAPDDVLGEVPIAYLVVHGAADATRVAADARARCGTDLTRQQQPRDIRVVVGLPRGATGKTSRARVREFGTGLVIRARA